MWTSGRAYQSMQLFSKMWLAQFSRVNVLRNESEIQHDDFYTEIDCHVRFMQLARVSLKTDTIEAEGSDMWSPDVLYSARQSALSPIGTQRPGRRNKCPVRFNLKPSLVMGGSPAGSILRDLILCLFSATCIFNLYSCLGGIWERSALNIRKLYCLAHHFFFSFNNCAKWTFDQWPHWTFWDSYDFCIELTFGVFICVSIFLERMQVYYIHVFRCIAQRFQLLSTYKFSFNTSPHEINFS